MASPTIRNVPGAYGKRSSRDPLVSSILDGNRREGRVSNNKQSLPIHREIHQPGKESFFIVNNSKPYSLYKIAKSRLSYERVEPEQNKV